MNTNSLLQFEIALRFAAQQRVQSFDQWRYMRGQQARLQLPQQFLHRQQRVDFACAEPHSRDFIARPVGRETKPIAAPISIVFNRGV